LSPILATRGAGSAYGFGRMAEKSLYNPIQTFNSIASITLTSETTTISFTSITSGFKHLVLVFQNNSATSFNSAVQVRFNSDSSANYNYQIAIGNGDAQGSYAGSFVYQLLNSTNLNNSGWNSSNFTNGKYFPSASYLTIFDYANTSFYKNTLTRVGAMDREYSASGNGSSNLVSGVWKSTAAISSISFVATYFGGFTNIGNGTQISLYGIN
jgi:hypothetical protein